MPVQKEKLFVFIDYSNTYNRIKDIHKKSKCFNNPNWPTFFDPRILSKGLLQDRTLEQIMFYCTKPPTCRLRGNTKEQDSYHEQMRYIMKLEGCSGLTVKYGNLKGIPGDWREKGLDTQLSVDMIMHAVNEQYDTAILVSNDTDYVPAVQAVRSLGKKVELLFFKGNPCDELKNLCNTTIRARSKYFEPLRM
ncbi:NYN domain-containing protein [bacterium]|nr:NYN domain-containing protein [bacterium]